ncbi:MAG: HEAT repeat domain-containing protein, partial [Nitrospirales bacterium]
MESISHQSIRSAFLLLLMVTPHLSGLAQESLVQRVISQDGTVRDAALKELSSVGPAAKQELAPLLVKYWKEPAYKASSVPIWAQKGMVQIGPVGIPLLIETMKDQDHEARTLAMETLAEIKPVSNEVALLALHAAEDPYWGVQVWAIKALEQVYPTTPEISRVLREKTIAQRDAVRATALTALGNIRPVAINALPDIIAALSDSKPGFRQCASQALGQMGKEAEPAVKDLARLLGDPVGYVGLSASEAMAKIGRPAVPALIQAMKSPDIYVRQRAINALTRIGPASQEVESVFIAALRDPNPDVSRQAFYAVKLQTAHTPEVERALRDYDQRQHALQEQEKLKETTDREHLWAKGEMVASLPADDEFKYPAELVYGGTFPGWNMEEFFVTLHRGMDRPDRLVIWKRSANKYQQLEVMTSEAHSSHFDETVRFMYDNQLFIVVPLIYSGTGRFHKDHVFCVLPRGTLKPVPFQEAPQGFRDLLKPGETINKDATNTYSNNQMTFQFSIWNKNDPNCCPTAGEVTGTYKMLHGSGSNCEGWTIGVDTYVRKPM